MDKKEKFLSLLSEIEPRINIYLKYLDTRIIRAFMVREKAFLKALAILMKNVLGMDFKKKVKTFWGEIFTYI
ncbi:MAG: hypothetical protein ACO2O4_01930 [Minisyncoccia bacterium]